MPKPVAQFGSLSPRNEEGLRRGDASNPGSAGRGRTRQAGRRRDRPSGFPPRALCLRRRQQGLRRGRRGWGRPSLSRAARPGGKKAGPAAAAASSARPRSPPGRGACALLPLGPPGPRGGHAHLAGAVDRLLRAGGEDAGTRAKRRRRQRARREKAGWGRSGPRRRRFQSLAANRVPAPACVKQGAAARAARRSPGTRRPTCVRATPHAPG